MITADEIQKIIGATIPYAAFAMSIYSLVVGHRRLTTAKENNTIAISAPWAQVLTQKIAEEISTTLADHDAFCRLYFVPFPTIESKTESRNELLKIRERSAATLRFLAAITNETSAADLQHSRQKLNFVEDSFEHNSALALDQKTQDRIRAEYSEKHLNYIQCIRAFAQNINGNVSSRSLGKTAVKSPSDTA